MKSKGRYRTISINTSRTPHIEIIDWSFIPTVDMVPHNEVEPKESFKCDIDGEYIFGRYAYDKTKVKIGKNAAFAKLIKYLMKELEIRQKKIQTKIDIVKTKSTYYIGD